MLFDSTVEIEVSRAWKPDNVDHTWQAWETPTGVRVLPLVDVRVDGYLRLPFTSP
jgi:hypothetical protein